MGLGGAGVFGGRGMLVCLCVWVCVFVGAVGQSFVLRRCASNTVFDSAAMECVSCSESSGDGRRVDRTSFGSVDALENFGSCRCDGGMMAQEGACAADSLSACGAFSCVSCGGGLASRRDGSGCMPCGSNSVLDASAGECVCNSTTAALAERSPSGALLSAKQCYECPERTQVFLTATGEYDADPYTCVGCPDANMTMSSAGVCTCDSGLRRSGIAALGPQYCVDEDIISFLSTLAASLDVARLVTFRAVEEPQTLQQVTQSGEESATFAHLWLWAAGRCLGWSDLRRDEDTRACQTLANLCVLQLYDGSSPACALFQSIADARPASQHGWSGWPSTLPFLYLSDASVVDASSELAQRYSFDAEHDPGSEDTHRFVLVRFALDGTLLGVDQLRFELQFCANKPQGSDALPSWSQYGSAVRETTTCDLSALLTSAAAQGQNLTRGTQFFDLYYVDYAQNPDGTDDDAVEEADEATSFPWGEDQGRRLLPLSIHPVPVRVTNLLDADGNAPNENAQPEDESDDILTRRFFVFDAATGRSGSTGVAKDDVTVVRYASAITLTFPARPDDRGLLFPPVLTVTYAERRAELFGAEENYHLAPATFTVHYRTDSSDFWTTAITIFAVAQTAGLVVVVIRMLNWQGKAARTPQEYAFGLRTMTRALVFLAHSFAQATFWVLFLLTGYWFVFFKLQARVFALLQDSHPSYTSESSTTLQSFVIAAFVAQTIRLFDILRTQTSLDVFLVDWEKPRSSLVRTGADFESGMRGGAAEATAGAPAVAAAGSGVATAQMYPPVSVWRTLFMANELSELSVIRRVSIPLTLILLTVIFEYDKLTYLATRQPDATNLEEGDLDPTLIFFNALVWFFFVTAPQFILNFFVMERFVDQNPARRLIDMCTVAKISMLILDDKYHGYYVHCDAPFEFADGDMRHLTQHLQDESGNVRRGRGLIGSPEVDVQVFELYLPEAWRRRYDEHYFRFRELEQHAAEAGGVKAGAGGAGAAGGGRARLGKKTLQDSQALNRELADARHEATVAIARFLKGFIISNDMSGGIKRVFRPRTYCQRFFSMPPDLDAENAGVAKGRDEGVAVLFYDREHGWEEIFFLGQEYDLLIWAFLLYVLVYIFSKSSIVAALVTILFDFALVEVRMRLGQSNLASKTLVDERFLE